MAVRQVRKYSSLVRRVRDDFQRARKPNTTCGLSATYNGIPKVATGTLFAAFDRDDLMRLAMDLLSKYDLPKIERQSHP